MKSCFSSMSFEANCLCLCSRDFRLSDPEERLGNGAGMLALGVMIGSVEILVILGLPHANLKWRPLLRSCRLREVVP